MAKVVTQFDIDLAQWQTKQLEIKASMKQLQAEARKSNIEEALTGGGRSGQGGGKVQLGQLSAQLQDIAVQAQMGIPAMTILTQQGSQMAGALGSDLAMAAGGLLAVGGALYTLGDAGNTAFQELIQGAEESSRQVGKLVALGGSLTKFSEALDNLKARTAALTQAREDLHSFFGVVSVAVGQMIGGENSWQREKAILEQQRELFEDRKKAADALVAQSERQTALAEMRAQGLLEEADAIQRQIDLEKELAEIRSSGVGLFAQDKLTANAKSRFEAGEEGVQREAEEKKRKEEEERAKRINSLQRQVEQNRFSLLPPQEQMDELENRLLDLMASASKELGGAWIESTEDWQRALEGVQAPEDLERMLEQLQEAQQAERELVALKKQEEAKNAKPEAQKAREERVRSARAPGEVAGAINVIFGRSANELILDETKQQTAELKGVRAELVKIRDAMKEGGGVFLDEVFGA
jgi:hypothetical protein